MTKAKERRNRPALDGSSSPPEMTSVRGANRARLSLHVPEPNARPGDPVDFSHLAIPAAGAARRPDVSAPASETHELVYSLVRVLDEEGKAVGPWDPRLDPRDAAPDAARHDAGARLRRPHVPRPAPGQDQLLHEVAPARRRSRSPRAHALDREDMCFPTYRQQGILVARDYPLVEMMCQVYSNRRDPLKGRQLPVMYSSEHYGFFSISGNLATQVPQAVGWAMASAIKGDSRIAAAWIGDGSTAEGDFHAA